MKTAQNIINNARFDLVTLIVTLIRKIDGYLESGSKNLMTTGEWVCVDFNGLDIADKTPVVNVEGCNEPQHIDYIVTSDDHYFYLSARETDIGADDISTDELVAIAKFLENTYDEF
jgi:hypothetical protein